MSELFDILTDKKNTSLFTSEELFRHTQLSEPQQQEIKEYGISITEFGISWILKLSEKLNEELKKDALEINHFSNILNIQLKLLVYILEDSNYLDTFPNQATLRCQLEQRLREAYWKKEGLELIESNQDISYIIDIARKLSTSGYVFEREHRVAVLFMLCLYSNRLVDLPIDHLIRLIQIFKDIVPDDILIKPVSLRLEKEQENLDDLLHYNKRNEIVQLRGENAIRLLATRILLSKLNIDTHEQITARIVLYRYLYILSDSKHEIIRDKAFEILINLHIPSRILFDWQDITDFTLPTFVKKIIASFSIMQESDPKKRVFKKNGEIILQKSCLRIYPNTTTKLALSKVADFFNSQLIISSSYKTTLPNNIDTLTSRWRTIIDEYSNRPKEDTVLIKERPVIGTMVKIQIKNLHPTNPLFAFVRILDERYEGEGVLHVKGITRVILCTLEGIIISGDIMTAKVIESTPDRLSFEIMDEIDTAVATRFHRDETTHAQLLAKRNDLLTWVSEDGYSLYSNPSSKFDPEIGEHYLLQLTEVNYNGYIKSKLIEPSTTDFDIHDAVADLIYHYKDIYDDEIEEDDDEPEYNLPEKIISELEYLLDTFSRTSVDIYQKVNYLFLNKLLNTITGNQKAKEYHSVQITYYLSLYKFAKGENIPEDGITEEMVKVFPILQNKRNTLSILSYNSEEYNSELLSMTNTEISAENIKLAQLVLIHNLLKKLKPEFAAQIKSDILSLLSLKLEKKEKEKEIVNRVSFGLENNYREFKTSIVYSNKNSLANLDLQLEIIFRTVSGFLNAQGGVVYIGVSDDGIPVGIQEDLQFMHCNEDTYQLKIRQYAVENLGKDINSLLTIRFKILNGKTVCAISVPPYHAVVKFHDTVFQRQGNATRPLQGKDVKLLTLRKKESKLSNKASNPSFPDEPEYNQNVSYRKSNRIATSILRNTTVQSKTEYFSILENGKYILTQTLPDNETQLTLSIPEDLTNYHMIFLYDNGYVNRVSASILSGKKLEFEYQNAINQDASILFVEFVRDDEYLYINSELKKEGYIKIIPINKIKTETELFKKGNQVVPACDRIIQVDILSPEQVINLHLDENKNSLGFPITALDFVQDTIYLKKLFEANSI